MEKHKMIFSRQTEKNQNKSLAQKTSSSVAIVLAVFLVIMVFGSALAASIKLNRAVTKHLTAISSENGTIVQNIMDNAAQYVSDLTNYMEAKFPEYDELLSSQPVDENGSLLPFDTQPSRVYENIDLIDFNQEVEDYLLYTIWNVVGEDDMVCGMGVFFEPDVFDPAIKDYTLYVGPSDVTAKTAQSYGAYSSYGAQEWYTGPSESKSAYISSIYEDQGVQMFTISYPIIYQNIVQGVVTVDVDINVFNRLNSEDETYDSLSAAVLSGDGTVIHDSQNKDQIGVSLNSVRSTAWNSISSGMAKDEMFQVTSKNASGIKEECFFYPISGQDGSTWWSMISVSSSDKNKETISLVVLMLFFAVLALIVIILFSSYFVARMLKPLNSVVNAAEEIAAGNLDVTLNVTSNDEIGQLAATFQKMSNNLRTIIQDVEYVLNEMSRGNFRVHTKTEELYMGEYQGMLKAIRVINKSLSNTLNQINASSEQVSNGSEQVSDGAQVLSEGTTEQAVSVDRLAAVIKEIEVQTNQTAQNANNANHLMSEVGSGIQVSNEKMQDMLQAMNEISEKSNEIGKIIKTVDDIAFQSNILALNAAVEAARAGSAGKGFAVVADKVRNLAQESAESVKSMTALINDTTASVTNGAAIAQNTAKALNDIIEITEKTVKNIEEISIAAGDQALAFNQITTGIDEISNVVQTNAATAQESAAASEVLSQEANNLKNMIAQFQLRDDT